MIEMVSIMKRNEALSYPNMVASKEQSSPSHCDGKEINFILYLLNAKQWVKRYERVLGHLLIRSLICPHHSLIRLLHNARFAALICSIA